MTTDLQAIGDDLFAALTHRADHTRRLRRRLRVAMLAVAAAGVLSAAALASGIADDLRLDPTTWSILGSGSVDGGKAAYVHARRVSDGSASTFLVEHDAGLPPYDAFLLHEKTLAGAEATSPVPVRVEPGAVCTKDELTRAESVALATLRATFSPGTDIDATKATVDVAVREAFAQAGCRGLEYGGEQARLVYAGIQPVAALMAGAR